MQNYLSTTGSGNHGMLPESLTDDVPSGLRFGRQHVAALRHLRRLRLLEIGYEVGGRHPGCCFMDFFAAARGGGAQRPDVLLRSAVLLSLIVIDSF